MFKNKDYSFLSRVLHHLALGNNFIPEILKIVLFSETSVTLASEFPKAFFKLINKSLLS